MQSVGARACAGLLALLFLSSDCAAPAAPTRAPAPDAPAQSPAPTAAAASAGSPAPAGPLTPPVDVKVAITEIAPEVGFYVAEDRGYFLEEGLNVELIPTRLTAGDRTAMLVRGDLQFASTTPDPSLFNVVAREVPLKIVAFMSGNVGGRNYRTAAIVMRQDHLDSGRWREPQDFRGMTVGLSGEGTGAQWFIDRGLARGGLTGADVTFQTVQMQDGPAALGNKVIDAAWLVEPFILFSETRNIGKPVLTTGELAPGVVGLLMLASPPFTKDNPEATYRFVRSWLRGQRDYFRAIIAQEGGADEIYDILARHTAVKDVSLWPRIGYHGADPNGELNEQSLNEFQDAFVGYGTQQQRVDLSKVIDRSFLDRVLQEQGRVDWQ